MDARVPKSQRVLAQNMEMMQESGSSPSKDIDRWDEELKGRGWISMAEAENRVLSSDGHSDLLNSRSPTRLRPASEERPP